MRGRAMRGKLLVRRASVSAAAAGPSAPDVTGFTTRASQRYDAEMDGHCPSSCSFFQRHGHEPIERLKSSPNPTALLRSNSTGLSWNSTEAVSLQHPHCIFADTHDLLRTSSRGCLEDATRKLHPWNLIFSQACLTNGQG